jgi:transposase
MTLIQAVKLNSIDPMAWLIAVRERVASGRIKANELHALLPWNCKRCGADTLRRGAVV